MKSTQPISRKDNIIVQELNGEVLLYDLNIDKAFCLNETSALVWDLCDGKNSVSEISQAIGKKLKVPANEDLVWLALDQLKAENLVETGLKASYFEGMNRRDVIKKVGLATMIALPVVASVVAPRAVHALSGCAATQTVTRTNATCAGSPGCLADCQFFYGLDATVISCANNTPAAGTRSCVCCDVIL
jgi:Coenzyme PQQ synthesis protein D (PqqD)